MSYIDGKWTNPHIGPNKEQIKKEFDRKCKPFMEPLTRAITDGMGADEIIQLVNDADHNAKVKRTRDIFETLVNTGLYSVDDIEKHLDTLRELGTNALETTNILKELREA